MPEKITACFCITTPMFIGDAEQNASGISPAAVKGALRFWFRALRWGHHRNVDGATDESALQSLHQEESSLFGSAADKGAGQAKVLIRIKPNSLKQGLPMDKTGPGLQYLLGQGLYHFKNGYLRKSALLEGQFEVSLLLKPGVSAQEKRSLLQAIQALGLLGALGSRARKGFGSIALEKLECSFAADTSIPVNITELKVLFNDWANSFSKTVPPFSAFSLESRIDISACANSAVGLHELAGHEMQMYRSWGRSAGNGAPHRVAGELAEQNFRSDHDGALSAAKGRQPVKMPKRSEFGLPHNYFFSSGENSGKKVDITPAEDSRNRRASPLFIHIHRFPNGKHALIQTLLPATFLPAGDSVEFRPNRGGTMHLSFDESQIDWKTIPAYLDRFDNRERLL